VPARQFIALLRRVTRTPEKWIADLSDVERALLAKSPFESDRRHAAELPDETAPTDEAELPDRDDPRASEEPSAS
jgi:hypothetical protein